MNYTSEDRLLLEQIFRHLELNAGVSYHPHRRLLNRIMNDTVAPLREPEFGWEGVSERLAKVERQLAVHTERFDVGAGLRAANARAVHERIDEIEHAFVQNVVDGQHYKLLDERIDKAVEIIGERISGLVNDNNMILDSVKRAHERIDDQRQIMGSDTAVEGAVSVLGRLGQLASAMLELNPGWRGWKSEPVSPTAPVDEYEDMQFSWEVVEEGGAAFPTGGADTAEAAADAALPVPQRGDRVRLEGAVSVGHTPIADSWYDVLGQQAGSFQVRFASDRGTPSDIVGLGLFWIDNQHPGLKEIKRNANT